MTDRSKVYEAIDSERDYQDQFWGAGHDDNNNIADFLIYIEQYVNKAKEIYTSTHQEKVVHELRKIAALTVACMEYHGTAKRKK